MSKNILIGFMATLREVAPSSTAVVGVVPVPPSRETTPVAGLTLRMYRPENSASGAMEGGEPAATAGGWGCG